jgi:hypothetical protein
MLAIAAVPNDRLFLFTGVKLSSSSMFSYTGAGDLLISRCFLRLFSNTCSIVGTFFTKLLKMSVSGILGFRLNRFLIGLI